MDASHPPRSDLEPLGLRHLALRVDNIEKARQELGLESGPVMKDWVGGRYCFAKDPDGNNIELHE